MVWVQSIGLQPLKSFFYFTDGHWSSSLSLTTLRYNAWYAFFTWTLALEIMIAESLKNVKIFGRRKCLKKTDTFIVSWCCSCGRGIFAGVFTQIFHINSDELNYFWRILKIALCLFQFHLIVLNSNSFSLWLHSCKFCL